MKTNPDDFEQRLQRQPPRSLPGDWKEDILRAARQAASGSSLLDPRSRSWWRELFWPHPVAWAGLAAVWMVVGLLNLALPNPGSDNVRTANVSSPTLKMVLAEQRQWREQLLQGTHDADSFPATTQPRAPMEERPRSSRRIHWDAA